MKIISTILALLLINSLSISKTKTGYYPGNGYRKVKIFRKIFSKNNVFLKQKIRSNQIIYTPINGILYALNLSNGKQLWNFPVGNSLDNTKVLSSKGNIFIGRKDSFFYCLKSRTGKVNWFRFINEGFSSSPVVNNKRVFACGDRSFFYEFNPQNGNILKRINVEGSEISPVVKKNTILIPGFRSISLYKYNGTYKKQWKVSFEENFKSRPSFDNQLVYSGSTDNNVYAINIKNGNIKWKFKTLGIVNSRILSYKKQVYFGSSDGNLYCLNKNNGKLIFKYKVGKSIAGSIIRYQRNIIFASKNGNIYAVDFKNGFLKWKYFIGSENIKQLYLKKNFLIAVDVSRAAYVISPFSGKLFWKFQPIQYSEATPENNFLYYTSKTNSKIIKYDYIKNKVVWQTKISSPSIYRPRIYNNTIVVLGFNSTHILNKNTGKIISISDIINYCNEPIFENGNIIGYNNKEVFCYNVNDFKIKWKRAIEGKVEKGFLLNDKKIYFGTLKGKLYCLDFKYGNIIFTKNFNSPIFGIPRIIGNKLYIGTNDYKLYTLNKNTGSKIWSYKTFGEIVCSPAIYKNKVFLSSRGNYVFCLNANNGKMIWAQTVRSRLNTSPIIFGNYLLTAGTSREIFFLNTSNGNLRKRFFIGNEVDGDIRIHNNLILFTSKAGIVYILNKK